MSISGIQLTNGTVPETALDPALTTKVNPTLSEVLGNGNTSGANNIVMDATQTITVDGAIFGESGFAVRGNTSLLLVAGQDATPSSGNPGGNLTVISGRGDAATSNAGQAVFKGGTAQGTGNGGNVIVEGGLGGSGGATGNGGNIDIRGGNTFATDGDSGAITIQTLNSTGNANAGNISLLAGTAPGAGTPGEIRFQARGSSLLEFNDSSNINLDGSFTATSLVGALNELKTAGGASALSAVLTAGNATGGTDIAITAGDKIVGAAAGGAILVQGALPAASGTGGSVTIEGGDGTGITNASGGNVILKPGMEDGTGSKGRVEIQLRDFVSVNTGITVDVRIPFNEPQIRAFDSATSGVDGTGLLIAGGNGNDSSGGAVSVFGGNGVGTSQNGGSASLVGGEGSTPNGDGGTVSLFGGSAAIGGTAANGGSVHIFAAQGEGTGGGGQIQMIAGSSGFTSGDGGDLIVAAGDAAGAGAGDGGDVSIDAGTGSGAGSAGTVSIGTTTNGQGVVICAGPVPLGFFGAVPVGKPTISGAKGGNTALASLISGLVALGLFTDTSAP